MNHKREQERIAELKANGNKHFIVTIYNLFCQNEKRYEDVYAMDSKEAEKIAIGGGLVNLQNGWGIWDCKEVDDDHSCLSIVQVEEVRKRINKVLTSIIPDSVYRNNVVDALMVDVCADIAECADWQNVLYGDEWCEGDIDIAIARVIRDKICE